VVFFWIVAKDRSVSSGDDVDQRVRGGYWRN
jgi:hypothetical protein